MGNSPIPTLGDWGLISLVVLLGAAAVLALRSGRAV
ncbi:MAG: IPTL-CTERM sorting domain-containing protein [Acidobacteria bacterium]|nr:IPTL-CTERM sorting domain-containing protein [Acidobacteriota bacterium]